MAAPVMKTAGVPLIKTAGVPAHDVNCCCGDCVYVMKPQPGPCVECATGDDPTSFSTPANFRFRIAGVSSGTNTGCGYYIEPGAGGQAYLSTIYPIDTCEQSAVATHSAFFNNDFVLAPCQSASYSECIYLGCMEPHVDFGGGSGTGPWYLIEYNRLVLGSSSGVNWTAAAELYSDVFGVLLGSGATESEICASFAGAGHTAYFHYSKSYKRFTFSRAQPTFQQWLYDTTLAPPETCEENIRINLLGKCVGTGWVVTSGLVFTDDSACKKALQFTGATCSVETV